MKQASRSSLAALLAWSSNPQQCCINKRAFTATTMPKREQKWSRAAAVGSSGSITKNDEFVNANGGVGGDTKDVSLERIVSSFRSQVKARKMGNFQLRQQLKPLNSIQALAALEGAKQGGLRITAESHEMILKMLLEGGNIKAILEHYQTMLKEKTVPTTETYNLLIQVCCDRELADSALSLFEDMRKRGRQPNVHSYELSMLAYSLQQPPQWEKAVEVFDKLVINRPEKISDKTYEALMKVYTNMEPFEWRVVYNCFYEMRNRTPRIQYTWDTYEVVAAAMRKGDASYYRRIGVFIDTWVQITPIRSASFLKGLALFFLFTMLLKYLLAELLKIMMKSADPLYRMRQDGGRAHGGSEFTKLLGSTPSLSLNK